MSLKQSKRPHLEMCSVRETTNARLGGARGRRGRIAQGWSKLVKILERGRVLTVLRKKPKPDEQITKAW